MQDVIGGNTFTELRPGLVDLFVEFLRDFSGCCADGSSGVRVNDYCKPSLGHAYFLGSCAWPMAWASDSRVPLVVGNAVVIKLVRLSKGSKAGGRSVGLSA